MGASYDAVVTEEDSFVKKNVLVCYQLHLGNQSPHVLVERHETAWPGGCVFADGPHIGDAMTFGISYGHTYPAVRNSARTIHFSLVLTAHHSPAFVAHDFHILVFKVAGGEAIVNPKETAHLHSLIGLAQLFHRFRLDANDFSRSNEMACLVFEIGEGCTLACYGHRSLFFTYNDGGASPTIACSNDAILGKQEHGA